MWVPKSRVEYATHNITVYRSCPYGCVYCYVWRSPLFSRRVQMGKYDPVREAWRLSKRCGVEDRVVVSFTSDPFPPEESFYRRTRKVLEVLSQGEATVLVLTKNPVLALQDTDVFLRREGFWLGTTVTRPPICRDSTKVIYTREGFLVCNDEVWKELEPKAPPVSLRIDAIKKASNLGIRTWFSIEPLIPFYDADGGPRNWVVDFLFKRARIDAGLVDWIVLGSLNYGGAWKTVSHVIGHEIDEEVLRRYYQVVVPEILDELERYGVKYYVKKELRRYLPGLKIRNSVPVGGGFKCVD